MRTFCLCIRQENEIRFRPGSRILFILFNNPLLALSAVSDGPESPLYDRNDSEQIRYWKWSFRDRQLPRSLVNCRALLEGDRHQQTSAKSYSRNHPRDTIRDSHFIRFTQNCSLFRRERGYVTQPVTPEEARFPIAFSILFYKDLQQVERLLRAIYRPQNLYCLHLDGYSDERLHLAAMALVRCFDNVFMVSKREKVVYEGFSRLQADINCMRDMQKRREPWRYYINLASQAFPLKTNLEMVKILDIFNGANDIEGMSESSVRGIASRYARRWRLVTNSPGARPRLRRTGDRKEGPPHGMALSRGSAYGIFSRAFVRFIVHNQTARDLLAWTRDTNSPDEIYWATLSNFHRTPQLKTPGGYAGATAKLTCVCKGGSWVWSRASLQELSLLLFPARVKQEQHQGSRGAGSRGAGSRGVGSRGVGWGQGVQGQGVWGQGVRGQGVRGQGVRACRS